MSATQDLVPPFDPTAYPTISGAQLLQYITGAYPNVDTGFCVYSADVAGVAVVPDAATYTKWQRYLWLRQTATGIIPYAWNTAATSDITYLKWQSIAVSSIGPGTIVGSMIADNTITDAKIISLDWSKITGVPSGLAPTGAAGGDLTGTYPSPTIDLAVVTGAKIAALTITGANVQDGVSAITGIPVSKLTPNAVGLLPVRTNAAANAVEYGTKGVLQYASVSNNAQTDLSGASTIPYDTNKPLISAGTEVMTCSITPLSATSTLVFDLCINIAQSHTGAVQMAAIAALFLKTGTGSSTSAIAATACRTAIYTASANSNDGYLILHHEQPSGAASELIFSVNVGEATAFAGGSLFLNGAAAGTLGGVNKSWLRITEVL